MIIPLSAVLVVSGIRQVMSVPVLPNPSAANLEAGSLFQDISGNPPLGSNALSLR